MKPSIQLTIGQSLTMTPQLQQAIKLLQLSTLELEQEIQETLDSNLMLEKVDADTSNMESEATPEAKQEQEQTAANEDKQDTDSQIPDELAVDAGWDDIYDGSTSYSAPSAEDYSDLFENQSGSGETLQEQLLWQMGLSRFSKTDEIIATTLIDSIGDDGYLMQPLEQIHEGICEQYPESEIELDEVEAVLKQIQNYDPIGVAARDLQECLSIQLNALPQDTKWLPEAKKLLSNYLNLLGTRQFTTLMRRLKLSEDELKEVIELIQSLNPRPGAQVTPSSTQYVVPDVFVFKKSGQWVVELNRDALPKIRINSAYAGLVKRGDNSADNTYLKTHLQEARWFLKSVQSRHETLFKVASSILNKQVDFFEYGPEAMKPLILREIAEEVDMHESTISRITTQKYMHTPRGVFEFKYFFSSHVSTVSGDDFSATAIRARIKALVENEPPQKPLSDSKISQILKDEGINVARRTIAKYRESINIPPSNERRRLG
ncbi:MAG: RNA polymerase factor sigma-54 [Gammaproteobacteria bacterium]|nr:MAG: RNA polymerase factor sigma-54 [Gammaproteobacteria bacterium]